MYEPDPKSVVDDVLGSSPDSDGPETGDDLEAAMADLCDAIKKSDYKAAAEAFRHALALADTKE